jgi:hypothetical protein
MYPLNVTEIESALMGLSAAHPTICQLIALPNPTVEGRISHAVRIGTSAANSVDTYFLTGGVHAREYGSCDMLVSLAADLCDAYAMGKGLGYGGKYFSAAEVKAIVEQMNVIIFPCVNPDGRAYSQSDPPTDAKKMWRKNRNQADSGGDPLKIGVDVNRNQDFLWDFRAAFAPAATGGNLASDSPASGVYHGSSAVSEAETRNVNFIFDSFPSIRWYVDVHSYSEDILYVWGDDELQVTDPSQSFQNSALNGTRGLIGGAYGEFMDDGDLARHIALAGAFTASLREVRGTNYVPKPGFSLYPTSGTNDDYAYSRHLVDPSKGKTLAFTVEWGTQFQPLPPEMQEVIKDVSAGLIGLGLKALGIDSFIVTDRDTFSSYEVETTLSYPNAFTVIYDGFAPTALGVPGAQPLIEFRDGINGPVIGSIHATLNGVDLENASLPSVPQRIAFRFQVDFVDTSAFTSDARTVYLHAKMAGITDVTPVRLIRQPNPYMVDGPISWLSTDLRVFQLKPNDKANPFSNVALEDPGAHPDAPIRYIQSLLGELRGSGNNPAPPFEHIAQDEWTSQLELSRTVGGTRVFNFAVAKVRYRANTQNAGDVRVFFRSFNTMVSDMSYTTTSNNVQNYRRTTSGTTPLLGTNAFFSGGNLNEIISIPYFAEARVDSGTRSMAAQTDDWNKRTLIHAGAQEAVEYFGCWLDFNQTELQFPQPAPANSDGPFTGRLPILQLVRGIHQCLVAEVRHQPGMTDPIISGATPASSDRLAQRNLAIVESDNPGTASTHVVQHTLLVKPSRAATVFTHGSANVEDGREVRPDELVVQWHDLPRDTVASFYFPEWSADEIVALAAERPEPSGLGKIDAHTIGCVVRDHLTYIPIPGRVAKPTPGLVTLELPLSVRDGQTFTVDVQHHSGLTFSKGFADRIEKHGRGQAEIHLSARKVLGAFRLGVAVKLGDGLLRKAVRNLAVLRYIAQAIPATNGWHPVFERYLAQLGGQVRGLGVDPDLVPASADDPGLPGRGHGAERCYTGKVSEVRFGCFGDFEGFVLDTCDECLWFPSTERRIAKLALRACKSRMVVTVSVGDGPHRRIREITFRSGWSG